MSSTPKFLNWNGFLKELLGALANQDGVVEMSLPRHPRLAPITAACLRDVYGDDAVELGQLLQNPAGWPPASNLGRRHQDVAEVIE